MIDTNTIAQAANNIAAASQAATQIKATMSPWMPALGVAGVFAGRELNRFCTSARGGAEWVLSHGGWIKLLAKLCWNSNGDVKDGATNEQKQNI